MSAKILSKIVFLLFILGALISAWLFKAHLEISSGQSGLQSSCSVLGVSAGGSGCETVALSKYSTIGIFPLASIAFGYFLAQILLWIWAIRNFQTRFEPMYFSYNLASLAVLVTLVMFCISKFILHSLCIGCFGLWSINILIFLLSVKILRIRWPEVISANLETIRHKNMTLDKGRIRKAMIVSTIAVLLSACSGAYLHSAQMSKYNFGGKDAAVSRYTSAAQIYLPAESLEGPTAKGASSDQAVLRIVKFSDFQCPACKRAAQFFKPFFLRHKDKIRYVYRNYPLDGACNPKIGTGPHPMACMAAMAGICAAKQGKFADFYEQAFDNQENLSPAMLQELAEKLKLDMATYKNCLEDPVTKDELLRDINWGESISLESTPTYIVNGRKIEGGFTPDQWEAVFESVDIKKE